MPPQPPRASTEKNVTNQERRALIAQLLTELFENVQNRQFYGTARINFSIQDGIIQTIQSQIEKSFK